MKYCDRYIWSDISVSAFVSSFFTRLVYSFLCDYIIQTICAHCLPQCIDVDKSGCLTLACFYFNLSVLFVEWSSGARGDRWCELLIAASLLLSVAGLVLLLSPPISRSPAAALHSACPLLLHHLQTESSGVQRKKKKDVHFDSSSVHQICTITFDSACSLHPIPCRCT